MAQGFLLTRQRMEKTEETPNRALDYEDGAGGFLCSLDSLMQGVHYTSAGLESLR
jgi:hypothetical protein